MVTARVVEHTDPRRRANVRPPGARPHAPEFPVDPKTARWAELYPFESHFFDVGEAGDPLWLHYLDEGPRDAPVVVMLHGNPTWSFMYRDVVSALRGQYRCIVPDHLGCGLSDRPQDWPYRLDGHAKNLGKLLEHLGVSDVTLMMHDWGGMIGSTWAVDHAEKVRALIVLNTAAFFGRLPFRIRTVRIPLFGKTAVLGFNAFVRAAMASCTHKKERLTPVIKDGYLAPYGSARDRIATLRFVEDVPLDEGHPTYPLVERIDAGLAELRSRPMLVCWGERDWCFTPAFREGWQQRFPAAEVHAYDDAAHFVLEDAKEHIIPLVEAFLAKNAPGGGSSGSPTDGRGL